jgi:hypothetical protein
MTVGRFGLRRGGGDWLWGVHDFFSDFLHLF